MYKIVKKFLPGQFLLLALIISPPTATGERLPYTVDEYTVGLWSFDNDSSNIVIDSSGTNHGIAKGSSDLSVGRFPRGRSFRGKGLGDYIEIPNHPSLNNLNQMTIELWVYPTDFDLSIWNGQEDLVSKGGSWHVSGHERFSLRAIRNEGPGNPAAGFDSIRFGFEVHIWDGPGASAYSQIFHKTKTWYYVVGTYDGSRAYLYVNGSLEAISEEATGITINNEEPLFINNHTFSQGNDQSSGRFGGQLDEIRLSSVARSDLEILEIYNKSAFDLEFPIPGFTPYTSTISGVFDHSMTTGANCPDDIVTAFTGEEGEKAYGTSPWSENATGSSCAGESLHGFCQFNCVPFEINNRYIGDVEYLFYDGHTGFDYPNSDGTCVTAAASGTVISVGGLFSEVVVQHSDEYTIHYLHLSSIDVNVSQEIVSGQKIGEIGSQHLHLTVKRDGQAVDPYGWTDTTRQDPFTSSFQTNNINLWSKNLIFRSTFECGDTSGWSSQQ